MSSYSPGSDLGQRLSRNREPIQVPRNLRRFRFRRRPRNALFQQHAGNLIRKRATASTWRELRPLSRGLKSEPTWQYKGFTISYEPGPKDADGKVAAYAVKTRETSPKGQEVSSLFSDESGRIHYRFDGPHGMGSTIAYFPGKDAFDRVLDCLWDASINSARELIDEHGDRVVTDRDQYVRHRLGERLFTDKRKFSSYGYNFEFGFTNENDGTINGFTVEVRPQQYGIAGIRSYLAVATIDLRTSRHSFNIHATPQNRSATLADPMTQPGEIKPPGYLSSEKPHN